MKSFDFDGQTPTKVKFSDLSQDAVFPCALRIVPIVSKPDREGFCNWVAIQYHGEDQKQAEHFGVLTRVDAKLIKLDRPANIYYGGGRNSGKFEIHLRRGAPEKIEHTLTQYVRAGEVGSDILIPVGAEELELSPGEGTPLLNRPSFELWSSDGPTLLSTHLSIATQTRVGIGAANFLRLLTAPVAGFFPFRWIIVP